MRDDLSSSSRLKDILVLSLIAYLPISRAVFFVRNSTNRALDEYSRIDPQNAINIAATVLMMAFLLRPRARSSILRVARGPSQWLVAYYAFCLVSCLWATSSTYVAYRAVELIVILFFVSYILDVIGDPRDGLLYLCRLCALTSLLPYVSQIVRNGGLFQHTNAFSTCGAFGAALALASIKRGVLRFSEVKYSLLICLAAVVFGTSSASNISLLIGIVMMAAAPKHRVVSVARLLVLSVLLFLVVTRGGEVVRPYVFPGKTVENIRSLRGRINLYRDFWDAFQEHPVVGHGFASGERSVEVLGGNTVNSAHNAVLSVAVNTGAIGLLFFCVGLWCIAWALYRADQMGDRVAYPVLVALIVGLVNSMSYPLLGSEWRYTTTPFLGILTYASVFLTPVHYPVRSECPPVWCGELPDTTEL